LKAKLYSQHMKNKAAKDAEFSASLSDISWGSQIRSYVMNPYQIVKDLRTGYESTNIHKILEGDIDEFLDACLDLKVD